MMNTFKVGLLSLTIILLAVFSLNGEYSPSSSLQATGYEQNSDKYSENSSAMESFRKAYLVKMLITMQKAKKI